MLKATEAQLAHREVWLRPADLSAAIAAAHQAPWVAPHLLGSDVGVVGFMRGATSALQLGGGQLDPERYGQLCDGPAASTGPDCAWFKRVGVAWHSADAKAAGQNHQDPRVRTVVAVAPELGQAFDTQSLARIALPVHLISLGQSESVPPFLDASHLARNIPGATHLVQSQANVFSAFGLCTAKAVRLLKEEGEDPTLCEEAGSRSRNALHADLAELIDTALRSSTAPERR
jgi:predicted dienelactone hydrolase